MEMSQNQKPLLKHNPLISLNKLIIINSVFDLLLVAAVSRSAGSEFAVVQVVAADIGSVWALLHVCWAEHDLLNRACVKLAVVEWITTYIRSIFTFLDVICAEKTIDNGASIELAVVEWVANDK